MLLYMSLEEQQKNCEKTFRLISTAHHMLIHTKNKDINILRRTSFCTFSLNQNISETLMITNYILNFSNRLTQI